MAGKCPKLTLLECEKNRWQTLEIFSIKEYKMPKKKQPNEIPSPGKIPEVKPDAIPENPVIPEEEPSVPGKDPDEKPPDEIPVPEETIL
jgi:hypothetical protein